MGNWSPGAPRPPSGVWLASESGLLLGRWSTSQASAHPRPPSRSPQRLRTAHPHPQFSSQTHTSRFPPLQSHTYLYFIKILIGCVYNWNCKEVLQYEANSFQQKRKVSKRPLDAQTKQILGLHSPKFSTAGGKISTSAVAMLAAALSEEYEQGVVGTLHPDYPLLPGAVGWFS